MNRIRDQLVEKASIRVSTAGEGAVSRIGPNAEFRDCVLDFSITAGALALFGSKFYGCKINFKKPTLNLLWCSNYLERCAFSGRLVGHSFGKWSEEPSDIGGIRDCDFSGAVLQGCQFFNVDPRSLKLPKWPCVTFLYPLRNFPEIMKVSWPRSLKHYIESYGESSPEATAITEYAPKLAEMFKVSEDEVRALASQLDDLVIF